MHKCLHQMAANDQVVLCEVLDRVLTKGTVLSGDLVVSVAGIDLLYVGLNVLLTSVDTAQRAIQRTRVEAK